MKTPEHLAAAEAVGEAEDGPGEALGPGRGAHQGLGLPEQLAGVGLVRQVVRAYGRVLRRVPGASRPGPFAQIKCFNQRAVQLLNRK